MDPEGDEKRARLRLKYTQAIVGAKDIAEVFASAVDGLSADLPSTAVLRRRIETLVEHFV